MAVKEGTKKLKVLRVERECDKHFVGKTVSAIMYSIAGAEYTIIDDEGNMTVLRETCVEEVKP